VKACGVAAAKLQGHSWAPTPSKGSGMNVGTISLVPPRLPSQGCGREDPSPADADGMGRRVRSSPRPGKPVTWRRDPACSQHQSRPRSSLVNTGDPWPDLFEAEYRVLVMQTKLHQWAKVDPGRRFDDVSTSSMTRRSSLWRGVG
jgi:hypothetical protein